MFWSLVLQFHSLQNGTEITPSNHNSKKAPKQLAIFSAMDRLREDWVSAPLLPPPTPTPSSVTQLPLHLVWVVPGLGSAFPAAYDLGRMSPHTKMGPFMCPHHRSGTEELGVGSLNCQAYDNQSLVASAL